jgi:hypothetical protein
VHNPLRNPPAASFHPDAATGSRTTERTTVNHTRLIRRVVIVIAGVLLTQTIMAVPSEADPSDDPCPLEMSFLCRFLPIAPELDGDVDLTKQLPSVDPAAPPQDSPPQGLCAAGCH